MAQTLEGSDLRSPIDLYIQLFLIYFARAMLGFLTFRSFWGSAPGVWGLRFRFQFPSPKP